MAPIVVEDGVREDEPQEIEFAEFEDEGEDFGDLEVKVGNQDEKDSTEEELERLVFGDSAGFRASLKKSKQIAKAEVQAEEEQEEDTGLGEAQDADVCSPTHREMNSRFLIAECSSSSSMLAHLIFQPNE